MAQTSPTGQADRTPTAPNPAVFALPSLARALTRRIVLLLLAVIMSTLASITVFIVWQSRLTQTEEDINARQMVHKRLELMQESWHREAENIATAIQLQRFASLPEEKRWSSLRAWLVALGENISFDSVIVLDSVGRPLFVHGHESDEIFAHPPDSHAIWYFSHNKQELHAVLRTSLWLGADDGQGEIVFLQPILPSTLQLISSDRRSVYLATRNELIAGADAVHIPVRAGARFQHDDQRWRIIEASLPGEPDARLLLRLPANAPAWFMPLIVGAIALGLTLALGIYLILGRWARDLVRRINTLGQAALAFGVDGNSDLPAARELLQSAKHKSDEVRRVADTLEDLMETVFLREEESRAYLETLNLLEEVVIELDMNGVIQRASAAWQRLSFRNSDTDAAGLPTRFQDALHPDDRIQMQAVFDAISTREKEQITLRARLHGDEIANIWMECRFLPLRDGIGKLIGVRGVLRDVTQNYIQEKQITQMALHDALTGLPNRVLLEDRAKMAIRIAQRSNQKVGLCFFDLDHFKQINDTLGHKTGDRLLIAISNAVRERLRSGDTLARWGGDEFVLLIPDMDSARDIREVVTKVANLTHTPLTVDGADFAISFSMGVTVFPDDADNLDALLSQADRAMFYAKAQGRNTFQFFADMAQKGLGRKELYIQHRLAAAIKNKEILTWFQPLVDAVDGKILGVEALARWHDPELGWLSPATFIPMAENLGLIRELGEQVWTATLAAGRAWKEVGYDLGLAVNISKRQLFMPDFTDKLVQDAARYGIAPERITLEITESIALLDVEFAEIGRAHV